MWNGWSVYWFAVWFALGFCVPEFYVLARGEPQNTLSDQVWRLEGNFGPPWTWTFAHFFIAAFFIWLAFHMIAHIWR